MHDILKPTFQTPDLPPAVALETVPVLKALAAANRALAELKGRAATIPNQGVLIDTLALQEAKASSEIENIVTTQDELFQVDLSRRGLNLAF
ncbi:Fic/DOC family N-terminal domain-containing protein [Arenibacterium sp. CAU 1754]